MSNLHDTIAKEAKLGNRVWCTKCGRSESVNPGWCLANGWPECCGYTMTIDSPERRKELAAERKQT